MPIEIKKLSVDDVALIASLETTCFDENTSWTQNMLTDSMSSPTTLFFGAFVQSKIVGYCAISDFGEETELLRICTATTCQRQGVGYALLSFVLNYLKNVSMQHIDISMTLEVNQNNDSAKKLYEKCGFKQIATRKNYYFEKGSYSDAIIMRLVL